LFYGPGNLSFDYYIRKHTDKNYNLSWYCFLNNVW
jgi:hypothetical protein